MIEDVVTSAGEPMSPERLVDACLDQLGAVSVSDDTRTALVDFASTEGERRPDTGRSDEDARRRVGGCCR